METTVEQTSFLPDLLKVKTVGQLEHEHWNRISDNLSSVHRVELDRRRYKAVELVHSDLGFKEHGLSHCITSDNVNDALDIPPGKKNDKNNNNMNGNLFRGGEWVLVTHKRSQRKGRHGSCVGLWTIHQYEKAARKCLDSMDYMAKRKYGLC